MLLHLANLNDTQLRHLGRAAVPRLIEHLTLPEGDRGRALFALQYQWTTAAEAPVAALLCDSESDVRRMAAIVLDRHLGREALAALCAQQVEHADDGVAGFCFEHAESMLPTLQRITEALTRSALAPRAARYLARYHSATLTPLTRAWLERDEPELVRSATIALVQQNDRAPRTRAHLRDQLAHADAACREAASEYCAWHGDDDDRAALSAALSTEADVHVQSALRDALVAIARRATVRATLPVIDAETGSAQTALPMDCAEALAQLEAGHNGAAARVHAWRVYAHAETGAPHWCFRGQTPNAEFVATSAARVALQSRLFAWSRQPSSLDPASAIATVEPALAIAIVAPTRDTLATPDDGFGLHTEAADLTFNRLVHVGDDVSWYHDHGTVVALADGCVRDVRVQYSWGYLVIIEHRLSLTAFPQLREPAERFAETIDETVIDADDSVHACSLYGHLGPWVRVRVGDTVAAGDKLATIGRTFTWENGGYPAHLHVGLHLGPFQQTPRVGSAVDINYAGERYRGTVVRKMGERIETRIRHRDNPNFLVYRSAAWECGYIARWYWRGGAHGWIGVKDLLRSAVTHTP